MVYVGNTVRLRAEFRDFDGNLVEPDDVTVTVYDQNKDSLVSEPGVMEEPGKYYYDYVITRGNDMPVAFEFKGFIDGKPILGRQLISLQWA